MFADVDERRTVIPQGTLPQLVLTVAEKESGPLHAVMLNQFADRALLLVDLFDGRVLRQFGLESVAGSSALPGVTVDGNIAIAASPAGDRVVVADARCGDTTGLVVLSPLTGAISRFVGPYPVAPMACAGWLLPAPSRDEWWLCSGLVPVPSN